MTSFPPFAWLPAACALAIVGMAAGIGWLRRHRRHDAVRQAPPPQTTLPMVRRAPNRVRARGAEPLSFERIRP